MAFAVIFILKKKKQNKTFLISQISSWETEKQKLSEMFFPAGVTGSFLISMFWALSALYTSWVFSSQPHDVACACKCGSVLAAWEATPERLRTKMNCVCFQTMISSLVYFSLVTDKFGKRTNPTHLLCSQDANKFICSQFIPLLRWC